MATLVARPLRTASRLALLATGAAVLLPGGVAYGLLFHFLPGVPWQDDYRAVLQFATTWRGLAGPGDKLRFLIAAQHMDYKLIFEHLVVLAQLAALGRVSFSGLMVLGDLFVLGILLVLWAMSFRAEGDLRRRLILFAPVSVLLFSLNYAETLDWAMAGLQNLPVIFFSLASLYWLARELEAAGTVKRGRFAGACAAALLACLSSANGFLLAPIGLAGLWRARRYGRAAIWSVAFAPAGWGYVYRFHPMGIPAHAAAYGKPLFFLSVMGGAAPAPLTIPMGACLLLVAAWWFRAGCASANLPAALATLWIVLTAALIAAGRGDLGLGAAHASRYKIYSDLMVIVCYVVAAERVQQAANFAAVRRRMYQAVLLLAGFYCLRADVSAWRLLSQRDSDLRTGLARYQAEPAVNSPMYISDPAVQREQAASEDEAVRIILTRAIAAGVYAPPSEVRRR